MKRFKNLRQGQTRWKAVLYEAGRFADYPDQAVCIVYSCRVTAVRGMTVYFRSENGPYIAGREGFFRTTLPTYRAAVRDAHRQLAQGAAS